MGSRSRRNSESVTQFCHLQSSLLPSQDLVSMTLDLELTMARTFNLGIYGRVVFIFLHFSLFKILSMLQWSLFFVVWFMLLSMADKVSKCQFGYQGFLYWREGGISLKALQGINLTPQNRPQKGLRSQALIFFLYCRSTRMTRRRWMNELIN